MTMVAALKHQPGGLPDLESQFRRDQTVGTATDTVGPEIFAHHEFPCSAESLARTSKSACLALANVPILAERTL